MAYIPVSPPFPHPPITASGLPPWLSLPSKFGVVTGGAGAIAGVVLTGIAAKRAGLTGATLQGAIIHSAVMGGLGLIPGVNLLAGFSALAKLAIGETLPEFVKQELIANPGSRSQPSITSGDLAGIALRLPPKRPLPPGAQAGVDIRTGGGVSKRTVALEADPNRQRRILIKQALQRVPFFGVPGIFTRRNLGVN